MEDCIFCKIASNEIKSTKIYEDNSFFAFLDLNPVSKGHVLIVPKSHSRWIHEAENNIISEIFILSKLIINKMRKGLSCDYVQVSVIGEQVSGMHYLRGKLQNILQLKRWNNMLIK